MSGGRHEDDSDGDQVGGGGAWGADEGDTAWVYPRIVDKDDDARRRIVVRSDLRAAVDEATAALASVGETWTRGGQLVDVVTTAEGPTIRHMTPAALRLRLADAAEWCRVESHEGKPKLVLTRPPMEIAVAVAEAGTWSGIHPLVGIGAGPLVRSDGTVASGRGYDPQTRWWSSADPTAWLPDPGSLCREVAEVALDDLVALTADYPVASEADRSALLTGLLTAVVRTAIDGPVPLHLVTATTRGSGKSLWIDVVARLSTGEAATRTPHATDEDEERKRIMAIIRSGAPVVLIDNIAGLLGSASLDALLTSRVWSDRVLGTSDTVRLPVASSWFATGNNVIVRGDLIRRTIPCRLVPQTERPEEREGLPDIEGEAVCDRDRLVKAALTVVLSYLRERERVTVRPYGSYSAWSRMVREPLIWLGRADPLDAQDGLRGMADVATDTATSLLGAIRAVWVDGTWTARDLGSAQQGSDLRGAIDEAGLVRGRDVDAVRLGYWLRRLRGRVLAGLTLEDCGTGHGNVRRWRVSRSV